MCNLIFIADVVSCAGRMKQQDLQLREVVRTELSFFII